MNTVLALAGDTTNAEQVVLVSVAVATVVLSWLLVNTVYELLSGVVGPSIGLYRTSLLAQEQFGLGRHQRHPQDFSFAYSVEAVS